MIADSGSTKKKAEEMRNYPVISRQDLDSYMSQSPAQEMIVTDISPVGTLVQDTQGGIEGSSAPALYCMITNLIHLINDRKHLLSCHSGRN